MPTIVSLGMPRPIPAPVLDARAREVPNANPAFDADAFAARRRPIERHGTA